MNQDMQGRGNVPPVPGMDVSPAHMTAAPEEPREGMPKRILRYVGANVWTVVMMVLGSVVGGLIVGLALTPALISQAGEDAALLQVMQTGSFDTTSLYELGGIWPAVLQGMTYATFVGIWIVTLIFLAVSKKSRFVLSHLGTARKGNNLRGLLAGLALGGVLNGLCALAAWLHGDVSLGLSGASAGALLGIFACVFVQSSAEELLCRGFLYQKALSYFDSPVAAVVLNSLLFAALHLANDGVTALSVANIFLVGVLFSLLVYYFDSIWAAMAAHASWNFLQNIVLGLPNSGVLPMYSAFHIESAQDSAFYNVGFGIEGTLFAAVLLAVSCVALVALGRRRAR